MRLLCMEYFGEPTQAILEFLAASMDRPESATQPFLVGRSVAWRHKERLCVRLWIGLLPFFKGSLTWENNAIFSSHYFTLRQCRNSTVNSERDHNLKPVKTDISTLVPWFDAMFGAWTGVQAFPRSDLSDHVGLLNQQKCVEDQFSWFESLGRLLCSTTVLCKRIVFAVNASEKDDSAGY